jgi:hypothetical protein
MAGQAFERGSSLMLLPVAAKIALHIECSVHPLGKQVCRSFWGTERAVEFEVLRRSTPRQTRWSPPRHWPVLLLLY